MSIVRRMLDGMSAEEAGDAIFTTLIAVASSRPTEPEASGIGNHDFVLWQLSAWM